MAGLPLPGSRRTKPAFIAQLPQAARILAAEEKRLRWAGRPSKPVGAARRLRVGSTPALFRRLWRACRPSVALPQHCARKPSPPLALRAAVEAMVRDRKGGLTADCRSVRAAGAGRTRREQMKLRSALLAATVLAMPFAASAQPVTGLYVGAGARRQPDAATSRSRTCRSQSALPAAAFDQWQPRGERWLCRPGFDWLGLRQRPPRRNRRQLSPQPLPVGFTGTAAVARRRRHPSRSTAAWSTCCTTSTACRHGSCRMSAPASATWADEKFHAYNGYASAGHSARRLDDDRQRSKASFAYQAILGAAFPIASMPGLAITAEYRFMGTAGTAATAALPARSARRPGAASAGLELQPLLPGWPPLQLRRSAAAAAGRLRAGTGARRRPAPTWCSSTGTRRR